MHPATLSVLSPFEETERGFGIVDGTLALVHNDQADANEPRLELAERAFRLATRDLAAAEQEYLAQNKRLLARRLLPNVRIGHEERENGLWELVKRSYAEQNASDDVAGEALTSLTYERERRATFVNNIIGQQAPGIEAARRFCPHGIFAMKGTLYALEPEEEVPRLVTEKGRFGVRKIGTTAQLLAAHDGIIRARAQRLLSASPLPLDELLWPGPERAMAARPDHRLTIEERAPGVYFLNVKAGPYIVRWSQEGMTADFLMDGCTAGYVVRSQRGGFILENKPVIVAPIPYEHPFAFGQNRLCFNDSTTPNRWTRNGIVWGARMDAQSEDGRKELAYKIAFPAAEFIRTAHLGYGSRSMPYHHLGAFEKRKVTKEEILRRGVRIYDNARLELRTSAA